MGHADFLWKILIVENRLINEIIDKIDHSSVVNSCENKGQNAYLHSILFTSFIPFHSGKHLTFFLKKSTELR